MDMHPLRAWRKKNNLSLEAFGRQIGVNRSTLSYYESRTHIPRPRIMEKIRQATGGAVRPADFYITAEAAE